ncbi:MAG: YggS family pyridoxal phosphate-dependent enzyme [Omnitrophica WOR_2 bacterium]|jgi:pyridoxal phosphate enzyme (YggS family)
MIDNIKKILSDIPSHVQLVAVSKTRTVDEIMEVYKRGIMDFGENKVQELLLKETRLPKDIRWHLIGHLQTNKVKNIIPFITLIHSVDSFKLLKEIDYQAKKHSKVIDCLLQVYIAQEETKFGLDYTEVETLLKSEQYKQLRNIRITGLMGMATFTDNINQVRQEFHSLKTFFDLIKLNYFSETQSFSILSMGMSGDYKIAIDEGSNMVRIGTAIFGERIYTTK